MTAFSEFHSAKSTNGEKNALRVSMAAVEVDVVVENFCAH